MTARLIAFVLLGGLCVAAQTPAAESGVILVSLLDRPVGRETYSIWPDPDGITFTADLDLTERAGRLQVTSSLRSTSDLTPLEFSVKGKSYRFVNVDAAVKIAGGRATVTNLGETKTFEAPRRFFTAQSYAPLSARALLIRYWKQHGQPETLAVLPGEPDRDVRISFIAHDHGSATRVPAQAMGLSKGTGTIEAGKRADLIVLSADPLANISNIRKLRWVIANGRVMEPSKLWAAAGFK